MRIYRITVAVGDQEEYEEVETHDDNESGVKLLFGRLVTKYLQEEPLAVLTLSRFEVKKMDPWVEIDRAPRLPQMQS